MALVKPMIQSGSKSYEDEIFIDDGAYKKEAGNKSSFHSNDNQQIIIKPLVKQESIKIISNLGADAKNKLCSKETIMRRKRNSLSMLGVCARFTCKSYYFLLNMMFTICI